MSVHTKKRGGGATIGSAVTGGTATHVLYVDASGNLAGSPNLTFDAANKLWQRIHDHGDTNPATAAIQTAMRNNTANVLWMHALSSTGVRRSAWGWTTVAGDDFFNAYGANGWRMLAGAVETMRSSNAYGVRLMSSLQELKGADVASGTTLTFNPLLGNSFDITGTTTINHITTTNWQAGSIILLQFDASVTVTHNAGSPPGGTAPILLAGGNMSATAGDTLKLWYDGAAWREVSRAVI